MTTSNKHFAAKTVLQQVDENIAALKDVPSALEFLYQVRPYVWAGTDALRQKGTAREAIRHFRNLVDAYIQAFPEEEGLQKLRDVGLPVVEKQLEAAL